MSRIVQVSKPVAADPGLFFTVNLSEFDPAEISNHLRIYTNIQVDGGETHYARLGIYRPDDLSDDLVVLLPYNANNYDSATSIHVSIHVREKKNDEWVDFGDKIPAYSGTITDLNPGNHLIFKPSGQTPPDQGNNDVKFANVIASSINGFAFQVDLSSVDLETIPPNEIETQGVVIDFEIIDYSGEPVTPKIRVRRNKPIELLVPLIIAVPCNVPSTAGQGLSARIWVMRNIIGEGTTNLGADSQPYEVPITHITNSEFTYELVTNFGSP